MDIENATKKELIDLVRTLSEDHNAEIDELRTRIEEQQDIIASREAWVRVDVAERTVKELKEQVKDLKVEVDKKDGYLKTANAQTKRKSVRILQLEDKLERYQRREMY